VKGSTNRLCGRVKWLCSMASSFVLTAALTVQGQIVTLTDKSAVAVVNLDSGASNALGMTSWTIAGINNLAQQWFWYRIGDSGAESPINAIGGLSFSQPDARTLYATYDNGSYGVTIHYLLTGSAFGPGISNVSSDISEGISIVNHTANPLAFHFFQYSDFDLLGTPTGDTVQLGKNLRGLFNEADQTKSGGPITAALTETVVTPGANEGEAALFNTTLTKLSNSTTDDLNNDPGPATGDATWALQWDLTIPGGGSVGITKDKYIQITNIPEPCLFAFFSLGSVGYMLRKRRSS